MNKKNNSTGNKNKKQQQQQQEIVDSDSNSDSDYDPECHYNILGVKKTATLAEIRKQWKKLTIKYHPDKVLEEDKGVADEKIKQINNAYEILKDKKRRAYYDKFGRHVPEGFFTDKTGGPGINTGKGFQFRPDFYKNNPEDQEYEEYDGPVDLEGLNIPGMPNMHGGDPQKIFDEVFGDLIRKNKAKKNTVKLEPIRINIELTLEEIYTGVEWTDDVERYSFCSDCDGTSYPDKVIHKCKFCDGAGDIVTIKHKGPGSMTQTQRDCDKCYGSGRDNEATKCKSCKDGLVLEVLTLSHTFEPGIETGEVINMGYIGHQAQKGKLSATERGVVELIVRESLHDVFKRGVTIDNIIEQENLALELQIELHEAICGFSRIIEHLDGSKLYIDSKDIVKDGEMKIIKGKGLPTINKSYKKYGDLLVIFKVKYPEKFTATMKSKIYELLTNQKYSHAKVHKIPKNIKPIDFLDIDTNKMYKYGVPVEVVLIDYNQENEEDDPNYQFQKLHQFQQHVSQSQSQYQDEEQEQDSNGCKTQ